MNNRRRLVGTVKSNKMDKTVKVEVSHTYQHPLYHKVVRGTNTFVAHDEIGCNVGDKVRIVESAPISRTKHWVVEEVIKVELRKQGEIDAIAVADIEVVAAEAPVETVMADVEAVAAEAPVEAVIGDAEVEQEPADDGETK